MGVEDKPDEASPEQKEFKGQKWDYKFLARGRGIKGSWTGTYPEATPWNKEIETEVKKLGEEGWELITILPRSSWAGQGAGFTSDELWVFKRPQTKNSTTS